MPLITDAYAVKYNQQIGKGATGKVYLAKRRADDLSTAVKIVEFNNLNSELVRSITNEVKALKILSHPNIVKLYDLYEEPHHFFIIMEYLEGGELFDRITEKTYYVEKDAQEVCRHILSALQHCHQHDIVHRDLKPENLMMAKRGDDFDVKLVDFGFACSVSNDHSLNGTLGTPMYMAPEIWSKAPYGKPVDMWSFGVITYILLGGYPPFHDDNRERLVKRILRGTFVFDEQFWGEVSDVAKDFISKLLQVNPDDRMTVEEAFNHPWLKEDRNNDISSNLEKLREFNAKRKLKGAIQAIMVTQRMSRVFSLRSSSLLSPSSKSNKGDGTIDEGDEEDDDDDAGGPRGLDGKLMSSKDEKHKADLKQQINSLIRQYSNGGAITDTVITTAVNTTTTTMSDNTNTTTTTTTTTTTDSIAMDISPASVSTNGST